MSSRTRGSAGSARRLERDTYFRVSMRPLHILVFLAPLLVLYEVGTALYLRDEAIRAHRLLAGWFNTFGVSGMSLPAIVVVVVLLVWHVLRRDRWRLELPVLGAMALEAVAWTPPLVVLALVVQPALAEGVAAIAAAATGAGPVTAAGAPALGELSRPARATIAVGAGVYEELLFRMMGVALVHFIVVDLLKASHRVGVAVAVVATALAFAVYHDVWLAGGGVEVARVGLYFVMGVYLGLLYVLRGFGIVVAVHALYDLVVLLPGD